MRIVAASMVVLLLLAGCSTPGPLEEGRWFVPNPPSAGPILFLARSLANAGLASVYAAACLAYAFKRSEAENWRDKDRAYQLSRPP